jgi:DNA-binding CsgD family transcriptional regulator
LGYGDVYFSGQVLRFGEVWEENSASDRNYPILPNVNSYMASAMAYLMSIDESILNLLEALGCGGLLLDKKGRVLQTNEKARRYLGSQFNIKRRGGVPEGTTNDKVQAALRKALEKSTQVVPVLGEHIVVPRATSRPLLLRNVLLPGMAEPAGEQLTAIIVLDLEDCPLPDEKLLRDLFLLTPAEARLAKRLSCGEDLASIAKGLGVARGTLRAQLKALFWKTGTRRQGELIALLAHLSRLQSE